MIKVFLHLTCFVANHGPEKMLPRRVNFVHLLKGLNEAHRKANRMALSAILMVSIMLRTDLNPFIELKPIAKQRYVISGKDTTIQYLANIVLFLSHSLLMLNTYELMGEE